MALLDNAGIRKRARADDVIARRPGFLLNARCGKFTASDSRLWERSCSNDIALSGVDILCSPAGIDSTTA